MTKSQFQLFIFNEAKNRLEHHHVMNYKQRRRLLRAGQPIPPYEVPSCCSMAAKKARRLRAQFVSALRNAREDSGVSYEAGGSSLNFINNFESMHRGVRRLLEEAGL